MWHTNAQRRLDVVLYIFNKIPTGIQCISFGVMCYDMRSALKSHCLTSWNPPAATATHSMFAHGC